MPLITLPDGSARQFDQPVTGFEVVADIGAGLAKAALAIEINGVQKDLSTTITTDCCLKVLTAKDTGGLDVLRHTLAAQVLTRAVKELYPDAKFAIGPTIEHGFYHDFELNVTLRPEDLSTIEDRMRQIIKENLPITRELWPREKAIALFAERGQHYKVEIIEKAPADQVDISLYRQGVPGQEAYMDLCLGPHLPSTGKAGFAFKLMSLAGAYWRGDSKNKMLTRIYGSAWATEKELKDHLHFLEEAGRRDHRKIGKQQALFHLQEEAPGMVFWHPNGWQLWQVLEQYMRVRQVEQGYQEVKTPTILDRQLWEKSGHWENYRENMFTTHSESHDFAVKPMNCPCHVQIFNHGLRSYRDLPLRLAEFGSCHRNEPSGALHGLMRVRGFVQDDAHIFCTDTQVVDEVQKFHEFAMSVYADFGFKDISVKLALRPDQRAGSDEIWDQAESGLRIALNACGITWEELAGEGAFYGPKVEYHIKDAIGRSWQVGTIQLDFVLPTRLGAEYVAEDNTRKAPIMLHRAVLGSFERFLGILIEHYSGHFPAWLAPAQIMIMNITDNQKEYAEKTVAHYQKRGYRVVSDLRNEKIGYKIREATMARIPYLLVVGDREMQELTVAVRTRHGQDLGSQSWDDFEKNLMEEIAKKGRTDA